MLKKNLISNFLCQGWSALMSLAFIPLYIKYLGIGAWGLVGFMAMLQAWLGIVDMGLVPALSREMTHFQAGVNGDKLVRNVLRTFELIYVSVALLVILVVWLSAGWIAENWLRLVSISMGDTQTLVEIMGLIISLRLLEQVYRGSLQGLQSHTTLNILQALMSTFRWFGALIVLECLSATMQAFLIWQAIISVLTILIFALLTYSNLPEQKERARFSVEYLESALGFMGGTAITTLLSLILTQTDKLLLSYLLPIEEFGYYTFAGNISNGLYFLITPVYIAMLPKFTELVATKSADKLKIYFHLSSQLMGIVLIPIALWLSFFSNAIIYVWSGNSDLSENTGPFLMILSLGVMFHGFMYIPYALQLAYGRTDFAIKTNLMALVLIIPMTLWVTPRYGAIGAAFIWLFLTIGYISVGLSLMFKEYFLKEKSFWFTQSIFKPMIIGICIILVSKFVAKWIDFSEARADIAVRLIFILFVMIVIIAVASPIRKYCFNTIRLR